MPAWPCLQVAQEPAVHHDLSDAVKMVDEYHHELVKYFSHLYLDNFESDLMVRVERSACAYGVSLFGGMEWWNGTVEWNSGMVDYWNSGMTTPTDSVR